MLSHLLAADAALRTWLTLHHVPWLDAVMWTLSAVGEVGSIWVVIGIVAALGDGRRWPAVWQVVLAVVVCQLAVDHGIKPLIARPRPFDHLPDIRVVGWHPRSYSFPSGHAASAFACAYVLTKALPRGHAWLWLLAAAIAFSRVYNGVHYPLDVVCGGALGIAAGVLVTGGRAWYSRGSLAAPTGPQVT